MGKNVLQIDDINFKLNGRDFDMWGIRLANALENDRTALDVINNLDAYKRYGVNTFSVFLMGGSSGSANPFQCDGSINTKLRSSYSPLFKGRGDCEKLIYRNPYLDRLAAIIEEADKREMVVCVGIFYQMRINQLEGTEAIRNATRNVAAWLKEKDYRNIFMDLVNEYGHHGYSEREICRGMKYRGCKDGGEILIHDFKSVYPDVPVSISPCGVDVEGTKHYYTNFCNQDLVLVHYSADPRVIRSEFGRQIPVVCNEWGPGIALEPEFQWGLWTHRDKEKWEKAVRLIRGGGGKMFIFSMWKQIVNENGPHFEVGPKGAQPNEERGGTPSDEWLFDMVKRSQEAKLYKHPKDDYFPLPDSEGGWRSLHNPEDIFKVTWIKQHKLDEAYEYIKKDSKNGGLLVVKDGWLVYEKYFGRAHREAYVNLASCGKSFTSIAMGILLSERPELFPDGLDQKVFTRDYLPPEAFPLSDPAKADIKLGQLLAFTGGIRGNNPVYVDGKPKTLELVGPDGWESNIDLIAFGKRDGETKGVPYSTSTLWCRPGEGYSYASSSIHLVSVILRHLTGMELEEYIRHHLAEPMGWGRWGYGYRNCEELVHTPGSGGIVVRPTDMLRFGYLLLNKGRWGNRQLVPEEYIKHCSGKSPYNPHFPYSLQFDVNTDRYYAGLPEDAFWKRGSGGHCIYVVPSFNLVVWKIGGRDGQYESWNTGFPETREKSQENEDRTGWVRSVDEQTAVIDTLKIVIDSIADQ